MYDTSGAYISASFTSAVTPGSIWSGPPTNMCRIWRSRITRALAAAEGGTPGVTNICAAVRMGASGLRSSCANMLARNIRIEEDLVDQLFNSSEKRLARTLLLLARYGEGAAPSRVLPKLSQETLAEMVGTTRSRVNFFMNKFRKLGFIQYNGGLKINDALLSVVLHE